MKYIFRPSHDKWQEKTQAAGTANYNFPDFSTKRLEDLFILYSQINPPLATLSLLFDNIRRLTCCWASAGGAGAAVAGAGAGCGRG